ncbi:MAG: cobalamin-binding protein [Ruminococcaceae bacterium]|nr:cobalamin-binding protein [Oscillospiraceae bacterium]
MAKTNLTKLVESGDLKAIEEAVQEALDAGTSPDAVLDDMVRALSYVGERFQKKEIFISEMLIAAMTIQRGVNVLKPLYMENKALDRGVYILGTVKGDLHDIGKNIVAVMLEASGFRVIDLGVDVSAERFIEALRQNPDCRLVGISALLTTTLQSLKKTVEAIRAAGLREDLKIMVGGTPVTEEYARVIGADAYTEDAAAAAQKAVELIS